MSELESTQGFIPYRWQSSSPVSGQYHWPPAAAARSVVDRSRSVTADAADTDGSLLMPSPADDESTQGVWPIWVSSETVKLDVDGRYPQMTISGELTSGLASRVHWIAELTATGSSTWEGPIWYRDGREQLMPFTSVRVRAIRSWFLDLRRLTIEFTGPGSLERTRTYRWQAAGFGRVEFEFDRTEDANAVVQIDTGAHPNRPPGIRRERLSIDEVFERAGFEVSRSGGDGRVPLGGAGANGTWSDAEMHDAMVTYWSKFADLPAWSMWVFWCALHDRGTSLGGIMFDDIGPNHRQGTAIFTEAFIATPPRNDPSPADWVSRMRFWTAVHEMGHAFNLAHAWQKNLGNSWIPLANELEGRSFMNYPYRVSGGEKAFFADFDFRFSDQELLFLRHAPERFVQMGNADWFDDHGFEQAGSPASGLRLELRMQRRSEVFQFMEPVVLELKLANDGDQPVLVDADALTDGGDLTVIIKRDRTPARQWHPFATYARMGDQGALAPGEARYAPLSISAGLNGHDLAEPGAYTVQVALNTGGEMIVSNALRLRVAPPRTWEEEDLAGDFFTDDVGRVLSLGGSRVLTGATDTLENVVDRLPGRRVALHADAALAERRLRQFKYLAVGPDEAGDSLAERGAVIEVEPPDVSSAADRLESALVRPEDEAADTFGHIQLHRRIDELTSALAEEGDESTAAQCQNVLHDVLADRGVLPSVLDDIAARADALGPGDGGAPRSSKKATTKKATTKKASTKKAASKKAGSKKRAASKNAGSKRAPRRER